MSFNNERWLPVVGYEGLYEVSDYGRVRRLDRHVYAGQGRTRLAKGVDLSPHFDGLYERVRLKNGGVGRTYTVHSLVASAFLGPRSESLEVCHWDGDGSNNKVSNLRYDTPAANGEDRRRHGTSIQRVTRFERCFQGHEYLSSDDYYVSTTGAVKCLACDREKGARYRDMKRGGAPKRADRTHCKNGHPFDGTQKKPGGYVQRTCSVCALLRSRKYREERT